MRWLTYVLLACLCVQAFLLPAQRVAERAHFHWRAAPVQGPMVEREHTAQVDRRVHATSHGDDDDDDHDDAGAHDRSDQNEHEHEHEHHHGHSQLAVHDHANGDDDDAVYASTHDTESSSTQSHRLKRVLLDLDGPWMKAGPSTASRPGAQLVLAELTTHFSSRAVLPLERPPRARG